MSEWTFDYAMEQARLVLKDNWKLHSHDFVCSVLAPLVAKIDDRKDSPGVWDDAPEKAGFVSVSWFEDRDSDSPLLKSKDYTRELPKSREDEIAEKLLKKLCLPSALETARDTIKAALSEYAESIKAKAVF